MIDLIKGQIAPDMSQEEKIHRVREFLQILVLKILYDAGWFNNLAFMGGTDLRVLYDVRMFSEDMGFCLTHREGYNFRNLLKDLIYNLDKNGLKYDIKEREERTVQSVMLRFKELLFDLKLSSMQTQKLSVKLEIDTNPPSGWRTEISLVNKTYVFTVTHFDLPSLYATKIHACFYRKYTKGRDFYDLVWYLGRGIEPNYQLLNSAIYQTEKIEVNIGKTNYKDFLLEHLIKVDFDKVKRDVERFLIDKKELDVFDVNVIMNLVRRLNL